MSILGSLIGGLVPEVFGGVIQKGVQTLGNVISNRISQYDPTTKQNSSDQVNQNLQSLNKKVRVIQRDVKMLKQQMEIEQ